MHLEWEDNIEEALACFELEHQGLESALVRRTEENRKLKAELSRVKHSRTFRLQRKLNSMRKKLRSFFSSFPDRQHRPFFRAASVLSSRPAGRTTRSGKPWIPFYPRQLPIRKS